MASARFAEVAHRIILKGKRQFSLCHFNIFFPRQMTISNFKDDFHGAFYCPD